MLSDQKYEVNAGFFDAIDEDRQYSAEDMNRPYRKLISDGVFATPKGEPSNELQVYSAMDGMNIIVSAGNAIIGNKWFENPSDLIITVSQNTELLPRIDSIIAQVDKTQAGRAGNIVYRQGNASSNPIHPNINVEEDVIEFRLADIRISPSCVEVTQNLITDCRGSSECPWITSLIYQVDISTLYAQWQSAYQMFYDDQEVECDRIMTEFMQRMNQFHTNKEEEYNEWFSAITNDYEGKKEDFEEDFRDWFESLSYILDGDVAGHLYNLIEEKASKQEVTEAINNHNNTKVTTNEGIHGMRITSNGMLQVRDDEENWIDVVNGALSNNELFKPYDVSNIQAVAGNNKVIISWSDPEDKEINDNENQNVIVSKWNNTKVVMKTGSYPENVQDGTLVVDNHERNQYRDNGYEVTGLNNGTTYYFRFFIYSDLNAVNSNEVNKIEVTPSLTQIGKCRNIIVNTERGKAIVRWEEPEDPEGVWAGTKLVIKQGSYPTSSNDGTVVVTNTVLNQYQTNGYEINGLESGVIYYCQLFPYSIDNVYNMDEDNRFEIMIKAESVYGIKRSLSSSSTAWSRLEDATDLIANATKDGTSVNNDFDTLYPWSDIITVDISPNGTINKYYGDPDFSFTNPVGRIMTRFPEFWWKRYQENGYEYIYISDTEKDGYTKSEEFYLGRYTASGSGQNVNCKSGVANYTNITIANARTYTQNIGSGWGLMDIWRWSALQMLYLVEYADYNSQDKLGYGVCSGSQINSGGCDALGMKSGCLANAKATAVIYRGVENPFGNIYQWLDGINMSSGEQAYVCSDRNSYQTSKTNSPYSILGYVCPNSSGYISSVGYDASKPSIQLPTAVSGSDSTYIPDRFSYNSGGVAVFVGGRYTYDLYCGFWYTHSNTATYTSANIGFRPLFIPV